MRSKNTGARKALENVIHLVFLLCGIVAVGFVLVISVYLILSGLPAIRQIGLFRFLFGQVWDPTNTTTGAQYGILPFILTSIYGTAGAMVIGVPIGLMTAIFLAKLAPPRAAAVIRTAVQLLAGIPSVVYGLVGMIVLVPLIRTTFSLGSGACLLAAILVLSIMVLPSIINVSETALRAVPREYEEASLALGATATETYFRVSLHAARSGVATAVVLGVGRAIGEAMAIIMVAGNVANMPGLFQSVRFLTTGIISGMSYARWAVCISRPCFPSAWCCFCSLCSSTYFSTCSSKKRRRTDPWRKSCRPAAVCMTGGCGFWCGCARD